MLQLENIHTFYGPIEVFRGLDLKIGRNESSRYRQQRLRQINLSYDHLGCLKAFVRQNTSEWIRHNRLASSQDRRAGNKPGP